MSDKLRRDASENRRRLLDSAARIFAQEGLEAPVEEIARGAGVGMGTLYRRFATKDALIEQLVLDLFEAVLEAGREALAMPGGDGLETLIWRTGELHVGQRGCLTRMWTTATTESFVLELDQIVATLLGRAQHAGTIRADLEPTDVVLTMWALRGIVETATDVAPDAWRRYLSVSLAGMRPGAGDLNHPPMTSAERLAVTRSRLRPAAQN